jgi:hypothetical protein
MKNYRVTFYKLKKEEDSKGKPVVTGQEYVGSVVVDDDGTGKELSITGKAFRHAPNTYLYADKVVVEQL